MSVLVERKRPPSRRGNEPVKKRQKRSENGARDENERDGSARRRAVRFGASSADEERP
jgi:hypothetical protein